MNQLTLWTWVKELFFAPAREKPAGKQKAGRGAEGRTRATRKKTEQRRVRRQVGAHIEPKPAFAPAQAPVDGRAAPAAPQYPTKQALYDDMVRVLCARHNIRVKRWRTSMSGVAWEARYRDGSVTRFLESPQPKSPMSAAIFLHEVGHHVIGLGVYKPRCLEEYHAWMYSIEQMEAWGVEVTDKVRERMYKSLKYAVGKAKRRGIRKMPVELLSFL